ncbi:phage/plasmid replication protein, II/X family, partial [Vibrio aestuarianus]
MIDKLKISIPFKDDYVTATYQTRSGDCVCYVDIKECSRRGIGLEAKTIFFTGSIGAEQYEVADLRHPYESLPTHFTGMAFKIFQGTKFRN